jgi:hypothetical protein
MHSQYPAPAFENHASGDRDRIDCLSPPESEKRRLIEIYNRWLKILCGKATKQLGLSGRPPYAEVELLAGDDVRRAVIVRWSDREKKELFAQLWIDGDRPEVKYRFHGYGYPAEPSAAF